MYLRRTRPARWAALLAAPVLFACDAPLAPVLVEGAERFQPPPVYNLWWEMTEECSGRRRSLGRVRWYFVPGAQTITVNDQTVEGYWSSAGNAIVLAEEAMLSGRLVRHEMLHALLGDVGHSRDAFLKRCGGVVLCDGACLDEAEPLPLLGPALARVEPDALEIGVEIRPRAPSGELYGGFFALIVTARNPRSDSVVVSLPFLHSPVPGKSFEYRVEGPVGAVTGSVRARDEAVTRFAPGETKRQVFDFRLLIPGSDGEGLSAGTYRFHGGYGGHWAADAVTVTVQ